MTRTVLAGTTLAAAAALGVLPASAGNDSPNAPRANPERNWFCGTPAAWHVGFEMTGTSNDGRYATWRIQRIVDDPHQTRFDASFSADGSSVSWYCT